MPGRSARRALTLLLRTASLQKGDPLGFRKDKPAEVVAVAADWEYVLTDGNYVWKRK